MHVHRSVDDLPSFRNAVITIGTFDGVHEGHRRIIREMAEQAARVDGETVIITFDPHPRKIVQPERSLQLLNTLSEKIELLAATGIRHLVVVPFTREFSELTADEYIRDFLVARFRPHTIIIGYDHHFGKERKGNYRLLEEKSDAYGYRLVEIPKQVLDEIAVSSTKIRNALLNSNTDSANRLLGYQFFFEGKVVHGDKLGRKIGYPTANLVYTDPEKIRAGDGVYAAYVDYGGTRYKAMLSIGNRPTIPGSDQRVEVHIFDFSNEIYGEVLRVIIRKYLRPQEKYESLDALVKQLDEDRVNSLQVL